ncbi:hypothetical protein BKA59DRAFT_471116 [Fusarium tricinctum]|uniref:Uncharacterized protein n=1 Tax=Fusarium tricinctum TaxID=61284 RepID=A0A8K0S9I6_9HYPO|nr:hypothetical protein BKA59DRAFT_471116 [Fusarium tricinctum]
MTATLSLAWGVLHRLGNDSWFVVVAGLFLALIANKFGCLGVGYSRKKQTETQEGGWPCWYLDAHHPSLLSSVLSLFVPRATLTSTQCGCQYLNLAKLLG